MECNLRSGVRDQERKVIYIRYYITLIVFILLSFVLETKESNKEN
jgi:hypothetical protein